VERDGGSDADRHKDDAEDKEENGGHLKCCCFLETADC
jgi:hypothetical protein